MGDIRWPKINKNAEKTVYLNINETLKVQEGLREPTTSHWQNLYKENARKLYTTF